MNDPVGPGIEGCQNGWSKIVDDGRLPKGILLIEVWRDESDVVTALVNGEQASSSDVVMPGVFAMSGFGWSGRGTSKHDDWLMELVIADDLPDTIRRQLLRSHLMDKWGL